MIDLLTKPAHQITIQNVQSLITQQVPENEQIEYKKEIPVEGNGPWKNSRSISRKAKETILKESVGFANAYGGVLILGIEESQTSPPVAAKISPIPNCAELTKRLPMFFRDLVEPQMTQLEIFPLIVKDDTGVIVVRTGGRSRLSPHRVKGCRVCPIRRQDRCEELTMREIQDMTLNVARGLDRIDKMLAKRADDFEDEFNEVLKPYDAYGLRATAIPVDDIIYLDNVLPAHSTNPELNTNWKKVRRSNDEMTLEVDHIELPIFWRPMLRAARADSSDHFVNKRVIPFSKRDSNLYKELHCDGLVEIGFIDSRRTLDENKIYLNPHVPVVLLANLLVQVNRVRQQSGIPAMEYAVEVQLLVKTPIVVGRPGLQFTGGIDIAPDNKMFPRYSFQNFDATSDLLQLAHRDFFNMLGQNHYSTEDIWKIEDQ